MDADPDFPHAKFEAARVRGELTVPDLWVNYLAAGGRADLFDVDAHLHGVAPLAPFQQDVLAYTLNERLDELYRTFRVPYVTATPDAAPGDDLQTAIARLLDDTGPPLQPPPSPGIDQSDPTDNQP